MAVALLVGSGALFLMLWRERRSPTPPPARTVRPAVSGSNVGLLALRSGDFVGARGKERYGYVILNAWEWKEIKPLKARSPEAKVLVYKDMASTRSYAVRDGVDDEFLPTGVGWADAETTHPEWFLLDTGGERIEWVGYADHWWMDVGNRAYQDRWSANVLAELKDKTWDGVFLDNAIADPRAYLGGRTIERYPEGESYAAATESFLSRVAPPLEDAGLEVIPNISFERSVGWQDRYVRWSSLASGAFHEHWMTYRTEAQPESPLLADDEWASHMEQMDLMESRGRSYLAVTYGAVDDSALMTYARASFLLGWRGRRSAFVYSPYPAGTDPWRNEWTIDIGTPTGPRHRSGTAWRRDFTGGVVLVNPSSSTSATLDLGGEYLTDKGERVTFVTLAPTSGTVLRIAE